MPCIQMDADPNQHSPEGKVVFSPYFQMLQAVVIEDAVIYPLTGSALTVNILVLLGTPWDTGMEAQVCMVLYVDGAPIAARGTFCGMRAFLDAATFQRAAVFAGVLLGVIPPWAHFVPCPAERMAVLVESDVIGGVFR